MAKPMNVGYPGIGRLPEPPPQRDVFFAPSLAKELLDYLREAGINERAGVLLGQRDRTDTRISGLIFPPQVESGRLNCEFDVSSLDVIRHAIGSLTDAQLQKDNADIVGWFHSHPRLTLFMSNTDVQTLADWSQIDPRAIAVVADPFLMDTQQRRIAWWEHGRQAGFYVTLDESAADVVMTPQQATAMAQAIGAYGVIGSKWDIVTTGCVVRWRVMPGQGD
jgi:proteasome lid subunit RPN8/RPN11